MRRHNKFLQARPSATTNAMSKDLDWVLDEWNASSPEAKLKLVLAKIRHEEKLPTDAGRRAIV
jgi:hypothetical protein